MAGAGTTEIVTDFDELPSVVGRGFLGDWFVVDDAHVELFKQAVYIPQNPYRFEQGAYPSGLLEGFHLLGLLDHLSNPLLRLTEGRLAGWNYGLDRVRFVSVARVGDRLRLSGHVAEVRPHRDGFLLCLDCSIEAEGREKPVMVAAWRVLFTGDSSSGADHLVPVATT